MFAFKKLLINIKSYTFCSFSLMEKACNFPVKFAVLQNSKSVCGTNKSIKDENSICPKSNQLWRTEQYFCLHDEDERAILINYE